jgi:hypothetical protein
MLLKNNLRRRLIGGRNVQDGKTQLCGGGGDSEEVFADVTRVSDVHRSFCQECSVHLIHIGLAEIA